MKVRDNRVNKGRVSFTQRGKGEYTWRGSERLSPEAVCLVVFIRILFPG
jgi:hypothetical protein